MEKSSKWSKMADAGGGEENAEMVETQRKMSEPAQPANNHNAQAQKSETSKKSMKKKGGFGWLKSAEVLVH